MKDEIREKLKIKRRYFGEVQREVANANIRDNFFAAFGGYDSFFIYNSFGTEADTKEIINGLLKLGKKVYLPRVEGENIVPVPYGEVKKGAFGIEEPIGQAFAGEIQVTVAPLLAVNAKGQRIGYGKGYYDRYFKTAKTLRVGLGYYFQLQDFCGDSWDEPLDMFLCERGIFNFGK
ncbi:MAG: 5-formyltetrahydrofolate cyclo-ligase [Clostridia bacterium]|nr:5-formyltetrahydrofolate cyclo-ligase [Clostridia bacterium]